MAKKVTKKKTAKKTQTKKVQVDDNALLIVGERDIKYVELDIEFGKTMHELLLFHAKNNILNDEQALVNWAFVDLLTKGMKYCEPKDK